MRASLAYVVGSKPGRATKKDKKEREEEEEKEKKIGREGRTLTEGNNK